jgi:hypothetical protein
MYIGYSAVACLLKASCGTTDKTRGKYVNLLSVLVVCICSAIRMECDMCWNWIRNLRGGCPLQPIMPVNHAALPLSSLLALSVFHPLALHTSCVL